MEFSEKNMQVEVIGFKLVKNSTYNLGSVQFGQNRNILIKMPCLNENYLTETLIFKIKYGSTYEKQS